ncbi:hypothetical protein Q8F55_009026 [Vanrija albida]|uniref:Proteophosphoglycan ppg4 n=1 Tax=Vanrija albida TaxID=181172 RepID=A0ABR3PSN9_9TREE
MSPARASLPGGSGSARSSATPPRGPDQFELLYNSAVQSFVRRDHAKTQAALTRLLGLASQLPRDPTPWYELEQRGSKPGPADTGLSGEEWLTKTLKLAISANASLYSDAPRSFTSMQHLLPPAQPAAMLEYIRQLCNSTYGADLLPPQILSTFLLASLKLQPSEPSLAFAHALAEDWLAKLPDAFVLAIARDNRGQNRKRIEAAREGYLKVIELFVGEVLGREGEWEMARGLLEGEMVMGSKKKEALYRHLRTLEANKSHPPSPASSGILPSPSESSVSTMTSPTPTGKRRSRADSNATSSSEATARPAGIGALGDLTARSSRAVKGKARASRDESDADSTVQPPESEATAVPNKIYVRPPTGGSGSHRPRSTNAVLSLLPLSLQHRLQDLWSSSWAPVLPIPVLVILLFIYRRRRAGQPGTNVATVRERLQRARVQGLGPWIVWWLKWWAEKVAGVWKLGTTITYM